MAENELPSGLEKLKIDLKRDLDVSSGPAVGVNPFSIVCSHARKKQRKADQTTPCSNSEERNSCTRDIFGSGCTTAADPVDTCRCNVYVPTKFRNHVKHSSQAGSVLQIKSKSVFKRNILRKSKLNLLKLHDVTKETCQEVDPPSLASSANATHRHPTLGEIICKVNSSKCSQIQACAQKAKDSELFVEETTPIQDFKSLIPLNDKQIPRENPIFDTSSFKNVQINNSQRRRYRFDRTPIKSDDDELVCSVSKKLAVTGIASNNKASCSQEARLTANAYCDEHDISIDELASYFEDFVHIPKKMSLMAEQMYI